MDQELTKEELQDLYAWLDKIPLSRPKRHITRDFSDGGRKTNLGWLAGGAKHALVWLQTACSCTLRWFNCLSVEPCLVLAAEVVKHFLPKLVDLHNYTSANSTQQKLTNWDVLNRRGSFCFVFVKDQWKTQSGRRIAFPCPDPSSPAVFYAILIHKRCQHVSVASSQTIKYISKSKYDIITR